MNCPECGSELTKIDTECNSGSVLFTYNTYKCRSCQFEFNNNISNLEMFIVLMKRFDKIETMLKRIKPNCDLHNCGVEIISGEWNQR